MEKAAGREAAGRAVEEATVAVGSACAVCADGAHEISSAGERISWVRAGGGPSYPATFRLQATHRGYFFRRDLQEAL